MTREPDYARMYHALSQKRGEQYRELDRLTKSVMDLRKLFYDVDRLAEKAAMDFDESE